jgi:DNA (cytosine-5)-methyltransferase 1
MLLLDAFCGAGGATMGYHQAGFEVVGIDIEPQPNYPPFEFVQGDAVEFIRQHGHEFDVIHASPPCKVHTSLKAFSGPEHTDLVGATRDALRGLRLPRPYVIENVPGAPLYDPIVLCGSMFELGVRRHRLFESNLDLFQPECQHARQDAASPMYPTRRYHSGKPVVYMSPVIGVYGRGQGLGRNEFELWCKAMDIWWMSKVELAQAIPPAFTKYLGEQVMYQACGQTTELPRLA